MQVSTRLLRWLTLLTPPVIPQLWQKAGARLSRNRARKALRAFIKLHLGCGGNLLPGWANIDADGPEGSIRWDLTQSLPVRDGVIERIYSEHFIEHISFHQGHKLLRECHRVLRPGGVLRLSTPDLDVLIEAYQREALTEWKDVDWLPATACQMMNEGMHNWGHQFVYNRPELEALLRDCGFVDIRTLAWRQSAYPELANLECRPFHREIIIECRKPA